MVKVSSKNKRVKIPSHILLPGYHTSEGVLIHKPSYGLPTSQVSPRVFVSCGRGASSANAPNSVPREPVYTPVPVPCSVHYTRVVPLYIPHCVLPPWYYCLGTQYTRISPTFDLSRFNSMRQCYPTKPCIIIRHCSEQLLFTELMLQHYTPFLIKFISVDCYECDMDLVIINF